MKHTDIFAQRGVALTNKRWSWGGFDRDGKVHLNMWADRMIAFNRLSGDEKVRLESFRDQLNDCVAWIKKFRGDDKPLKEVVARAMEAAFLIGSDAIQSPIMRRFVREEKNARAAVARKTKDERSATIQATILDLHNSLLKRHPNKRPTKRWVADKILGDLLSRHPDSPVKTKDALARRLSKLAK